MPAGSEKVEVGAVLAILDEVSTSGATIVEEPAPAQAVTSIRPNGHPPAPAEGEPHTAATIAIPRTAETHPEIEATPLARSMALQAGLDLSSIRGSGPRGRVVHGDVLGALGVKPVAEEERPPLGPVAVGSAAPLPSPPPRPSMKCPIRASAV